MGSATMTSVGVTCNLGTSGCATAECATTTSQKASTVTQTIEKALSGSRFRDLAARLTTPLLPDDYLQLVNPLWSSRELRARVESVVPQGDDAATLVSRRADEGYLQQVEWVPVGDVPSVFAGHETIRRAVLALIGEGA